MLLGLTVVFEAMLSERSGDSGTSKRVSVGVGGVTVVTGVDMRAAGGVNGRLVKGRLAVSSAGIDFLAVLESSMGAGFGANAGASTFSAVKTVLLLLSGLVKPAFGFLSGLVRGLLLLEWKTSRNFRAGDLLRLLLILPRPESGSRVSALSMRPGLGREGIWFKGGLLGEGECSASVGSTNDGSVCA